MMRSHNRHHLEQNAPYSTSKNMEVYVTSSGHGPPPAADAHIYSQPTGYSSKASSTRGHLVAVSDPQLRLMEADRWSVESPKESGYYSEESSIGHSEVMPSSSSSSKDQGLHGRELCCCFMCKKDR